MTLPPELAAEERRIRAVAAGYGLDFFHTVFEMVGWKEMNTVAAYGGFPVRYPHWRFGMVYDQLAKGYAYGLSKIYELVINNDPCYAYLLEGNTLVDQKLVMAHVYAHCDFFKNNLWFAPTNRHMIDELATHATRVQRHVERHGFSEVESFLDSCLVLENLVDLYSLYAPRKPRRGGGDEEAPRQPVRFQAKSYMDRFINPPEFLEEQRKALDEERARPPRFPEKPERDVLLFLMEHAPLKPWQRDVLGMIRDEAYYFAPQAITKIMNEGWACVDGATPVFTSEGLLPMRQVVEGAAGAVSDGETARRVYDRHVIRDHATITLRTRRGLALTGSVNHRVLLADGVTWKRLDALRVGDRVRVAGGADLWPEEPARIAWRPATRVALEDVAETCGVSLSTVLRHRDGRRVRAGSRIAAALRRYDDPENLALPMALAKRRPIRVPEVCDASLGAFLGYLVGDGHISRRKRQVGMTTGDPEQAESFRALARELFGLEGRVRVETSKRRVLLHSEHLADFLEHGLGMPTGPCAQEKSVPEAVLRSPFPVVAAFLRAYFDCDGHAGPGGVILSTSSDRLADQTQLLLLNAGVLCRRRRTRDGWHVHVAGSAAARFEERVGFGLARKREALARYVRSRRWLERTAWDDEVVSLEPGRGEVFDISVETTHRYAAAGLVNHNSFWHSTMMTRDLLEPHEILDYAERHAGAMAIHPGRINPYKIGLELFRDIEERWDKGRFGKAYDECEDRERKRTWDLGLGKGRERIFEVRRIYNDVTFIDEFLTPEFCERQKLFTYEVNPKTGRPEVTGRDFHEIKRKLLQGLANAGQPIVEVADANFRNRGELVLRHRHDGEDLDLAQAQETLKHLFRVWTRPVHVETVVEGRRRRLSYDGREIETTDA